jgi:hypothetical protein
MRPHHAVLPRLHMNIAGYLWDTFTRFRWCNTHHCMESQPTEGYWPHGTYADQCWKTLIP